MLASLFASLFSRPAASLVDPGDAWEVVRYRGTAAGWQPVGSRTSYEAAARLRDTLRRISPTAHTRLSVRANRYT